MTPVHPKQGMRNPLDGVEVQQQLKSADNAGATA